jgi:large subunit ribosomal protein L20
MLASLRYATATAAPASAKCVGWIIRINAGARQNGLSYSRLIQGYTACQRGYQPQNTCDMAVTDPSSFAHLVQVAKEARAAA